jgi:predicted kinase
MRKGHSFVWNATNITRQMRSQLIDLFTSYGGRVTIVYIEAPYRKLLEQNHNRDSKIPEAAIENMINKLEVPTLLEAYDVIQVNSN